MSNGYTKLFSDILTSSIWCQDDQTRLVWITLLALSDAEGQVRAAMPGLAHAARVPREAAERAVAQFTAPDPDSRTPDNDGRRITPIPGGWRILNYTIYRNRLSLDPRKVADRERQRAHRAGLTTGVTLRDSHVTSCDVASASASAPDTHKRRRKPTKDPDYSPALHPDHAPQANIPDASPLPSPVDSRTPATA